jgi:hypothetical protein
MFSRLPTRWQDSRSTPPFQCLWPWHTAGHPETNLWTDFIPETWLQQFSKRVVAGNQNATAHRRRLLDIACLRAYSTGLYALNQLEFTAVLQHMWRSRSPRQWVVFRRAASCKPTCNYRDAGQQ